MKAPARSGNRGVTVVALLFVSLLTLTATLVGLSGGGASTVILDRSSLIEARRLLDEGKIAEARKIYEEEYRRNPKSVEVVKGLAFCARDEGNDEEAATWFERWTRLDPKSAAAWKQLALTNHRLGRDLEAMTAAQTAMSLSPEGDTAVNDLMTKLATSPKGSTEDPFTKIPDPLRDMDPTARGVIKGPGIDPTRGGARPEPPDPARGLPGFGKDK